MYTGILVRPIPALILTEGMSLPGVVWANDAAGVGGSMGFLACDEGLG